MSHEPPQKERILKMLRSAGSTGVKSSEFYAAYMPRAAARIKELRDMGYVIVSKPEPNNLVRYVLVGEPKRGSLAAVKERIERRKRRSA